MKQHQADRIFASYDAGIATLPTEILEARTAVQRLEAAVAALTAPTTTADEQAETLARQLAHDALKTADLDLVAITGTVVRARDADQAHDTRRRILYSAEEKARAHLSGAITDLADVVITEHLAPAIASTIDALRTEREKYRAHGEDRKALFSAPTKAREAYIAADRLIDTYRQLRATRADLLRAAGQTHAMAGYNDTTGMFAEINNPLHCWPDLAARITNGGNHAVIYNHTPPWVVEGDPGATLLHLIDAGGQFWCPTRHQQEQAWNAAFGGDLGLTSDELAHKKIRAENKPARQSRTVSA